MFGKKKIYLDNTATTRTRREVIAEINKYFKGIYANPSSIHEDGLLARGSIEMARERIAQVLNCYSDELIFTGSGSESNNLAIRGMAKSLATKGRHIITSKIEHSSIINTCKALENDGFEISWLNVDPSGRFNLDELGQLMRPDTILVSLGYINNEIGTIQNIAKTVAIVKDRGVLLHLDAVQALPYIKLNLTTLGADLISFSGHKLYAPKGVGILYVKRGTLPAPIIYGGEQEFGLRSGTENVPYIVGISKAIQLNDKEKDQYVKNLTFLRDRLIKGVLASVPDVLLTGDPATRAPNHASFCFQGINGKMLVKQLSQHGLEIASGSACSSPKNNPSHVLEACGVPANYLYGSIRVTLGKYNTRKDVDYFLEVLPQVVARMRSDEVPYDNANIFISQDELRQKIAAREDLQVIDVRHVKYPRLEIPGSLHIPVWRLKSSIRKLDRNKETIVVCYQGDIVSPQVHQTLVRKGFTKIKVLKGGLFNYFGFHV